MRDSATRFFLVGFILLVAGHLACSSDTSFMPIDEADRSGERMITPVDHWAALEARPLRIPTSPPGDACPVSAQVGLGEGRVVGEGPLYMAVGLRYGMGGNPEGGWYYWKVLWISTTDYQGPALIRGRQLDGPHEIRFDSGPDPAAAMRIPPGGDDVWGPGYGSTREVRMQPSYSRFAAPGCYGWQVDGLGFSYTIVVEVVDS